MLEHSEIEYNQLQRETVKFSEKDCNLVVMAPTSSGKTIVAEQFILPVLKSGMRAIYLSPLKALTNEKANAWKDWQYSMSIITSDYRNSSQVTSDLVLMTTESLDSRARSARAWLRKTRVLVVDEAHLLGSKGRGDALEMGLLRFTEQNKLARIVFLSATIPNAQALGSWLTSLNGKPTEIVSTTWRPVEQEFKKIVTSEREWDFDRDVIDLAKGLRANNPDKQILLFVHAIAKGHRYADALGAPFHYSRLTMPVRKKLEDKFSRKEIPLLVSTSTLAWGVNLPADIAIIAGAHRGPMLVTTTDLVQMAGRAGRYGLSEKGFVYFVLREDYAESVWRDLTDIPEVKSTLSDRLRFHVISLIARDNLSKKGILKFFERSFEGVSEKEVSDAIDQLEYCKAISPDFEVLRNGKASAMFYIDPLDLYVLLLNFADRPQTPTTIALAFANIPMFEVPTTVPGDLKKPLEMMFGKQTIVATILRDWISGKGMTSTGNAMIWSVRNDLGRYVEAMKMCTRNSSYFEALSCSLANGVPLSSVALAGLPGIGRARTMKLLNAGINSVEDLKLKKRLARNLLGNTVYEKALARESGKIILDW